MNTGHVLNLVFSKYVLSGYCREASIGKEHKKSSEHKLRSSLLNVQITNIIFLKLKITQLIRNVHPFIVNVQQSVHKNYFIHYQ